MRCTVEYMDRIRAQKIVDKLRDSYNRPVVASMLGITPIYVTFAEYNQRRGDGFVTPPKIIKQILEWSNQHVQSEKDTTLEQTIDMQSGG